MMDWTQWLYLALLGAALGFGRPGWLIASAMAFNLAATVLWASFPMSVAVADAICGAALLFGGKRAKAIGILFAAMVIWAVLAQSFGFPNSTTYAIVDVLAYGQLIIIGGSGVGMVRRVRTSRRFVDRRGSHHMGGMARGGASRVAHYLSFSE